MLRAAIFLIVEDIIDSGRTLAYLVDLFKYRKAKSVKIVTLLDKPEGRVVEIDADYVGFDVPNEFVVDMDWTMQSNIETYLTLAS